REYMGRMLSWARPVWIGHWPPYADYVGMGYDPNRWEEFELDERFYNATHEKLEAHVAASPKVYNPFPPYNSPAWNREWEGEYVPCQGPRELLLDNAEDQVYVYKGVPESFPKVFAGSYDVLGLDGDVCFDRYSRYGAYGLGNGTEDGSVVGWKAPKRHVQWKDVKWGRLQDECLERNKMRFAPEARVPMVKKPTTAFSAIESVQYYAEKGASEGPVVIDAHDSRVDLLGREEKTTLKRKYHHRTAVLIRAWTGYRYEENDIMAIRAMVSELALQSGGEYAVYLYVHVKNANQDIFNDADLYKRVVEDNVPEELRDIAILWSEAIFPEWYPNVGDYQVYWQQFMCLQWFSLTHPEFDYIWNWETDARYIGHHYHFLEKVSEFAERQPRKLIWERNKRFYIPSIHGTYKEFVERTHADVLNASANSLIPPPVWGPRPWKAAIPPQRPSGPTPPTSFEEDNFEWGVGEPADLITLLPIWDPRNTSWSFKDKIWNYIPGVRPLFTEQDWAADWFTHPDFAHLDRRVFINTVVRFSRRMLQAMHDENRAGRSMQAEMWPATVALQHGLKAVYAPHPIFNDREWPSTYAEAIFDAASTVDGETGAPVMQVQGAWTEQQDSPYNHDREYNFQGWSWYFASRFPRMLYRRWLGWEVEVSRWGVETVVEGGEEGEGEGERGRMCVPGMMLHPVKGMARERVR
ncbi:uncharacterized protein EI97DRAFT_366344, partial [Westerdykella ornata]